MNPANDDAVPVSSVSAQRLDAYVAGQLGAAERRAIEGYLACNPDLAAEVMARMHMTRGAAARPRRRRWFAALAAATAISACLGSGAIGWAAANEHELGGWREADGGDPPEYVEEAAQSRAAARVRQDMASQVETPRFDRAEIERSLRVNLPEIPPAWRPVDVQVYPTDEGPALNLVIDVPEVGPLTLFALRTGSLIASAPELAVRGREAAAVWEQDGVAFVLSGDAPRQVLMASARSLASSRKL